MARTSVRMPLSIASVVVAVDQVTKAFMVAWLDGGSRQLIDGVLQFKVTRNPGSAFSLFTSGGQVIAVVAIVISIVVVAVLPRVPLAIERVGLALVMGGAVGNLTDRIFRGEGILDGAVVDFIDFSFFPSFNVADSCITIGVALLLIAGFVVTPAREQEDPVTAGAPSDDAADA